MKENTLDLSEKELRLYKSIMMLRETKVGGFIGTVKHEELIARLGKLTNEIEEEFGIERSMSITSISSYLISLTAMSLAEEVVDKMCEDFDKAGKKLPDKVVRASIKVGKESEDSDKPKSN